MQEGQMIYKSCILALHDYYHEKLLSLCAVLSLAAVLAPLLVLYGVKFGVINTMTERLKNDPNNLEIVPIGSGNYNTSFINDLAKNPHVAFVLPRTRAIAATMSLAPEGETSIFKRINVSLEPTAKGDTLINHYVKDNPTPPPADAFSISLSAEAARKLKMQVNSIIQGMVERTHNGKIERATVKLWVANILPLEAEQKAVAFVPLSLLEATEDFRDGRKPKQDPKFTEALGWVGENLPDTERVYAAFRLYAKNLDAVTKLRDYFAKQNIDVYTQAEQIAAVRSLDSSLTLIFGLIGLAAAFGFVASTASNALASVRRKERYLGILRLMGYSSGDIMAFALFQNMLTAILGSLLAFVLYFATALAIDKLFANSLQGIEEISSLPFSHYLIGVGMVLALSFLATLLPAKQAAKIEPSEVIRDI